ncbi:transposase [Coraliomargarita sp. W4R72]
MAESSDHTRQRPVHLPSVESGNRGVIQFVTVCTQGRARVLDNDAAHTLLRDVWSDGSVYQVGRYILMPDHIHLFCAPNCYPTEPLSRWVGYWKSRAASHWPERLSIKLWQTDFWDRQLRSGESYSEKWAYVRNNPVRAKLVKSVEDWAWQGEMHQLSWHD